MAFILLRRLTSCFYYKVLEIKLSIQGFKLSNGNYEVPSDKHC